MQGFATALQIRCVADTEGLTLNNSSFHVDLFDPISILTNLQTDFRASLQRLWDKAVDSALLRHTRPCEMQAVQRLL